jgi:DNA-binding FadR family transcriptional regulator
MASPRLGALRRQPLLSEAIQTEIAKMIADRRLHSGEALPTETQLAHQLKVSRNSVREAVKALESLGVVEARVGAGLFVGHFSLQTLFDNAPLYLVRGLGDLTDTILLRLYLESGMAEVVVDRLTTEQLRNLRLIIKRWEGQAARGSIAPALDRNFHLLLTATVDNKLVSKTLDAFWQVRHLAAQRGELPTNTSAEQNYARHALILHALESRDPDKLRTAVRRHYEEVLKEITSGQTSNEAKGV